VKHHRRARASTGRLEHGGTVDGGDARARANKEAEM